MSKGNHETDTIDRVSVKTPKQYKVILLNDDFTPMEFVVAILETIFAKSPAEAVKIMLEVHNLGRGMCGIFTRQVAEMKVDAVAKKAKEARHPLRAIVEEV